MSWAHTAATFSALGAALVLCACTLDSSSSDSSSGGGWAASSSSSGGGSAPTLVDVDANRTMTADPGQGVGVFVEYATGGHWHVWWTCDTTATGLGCLFDIAASVTSGAITGLATQGFTASDRATQGAPGRVEGITETSTAVDGITFDTLPGAVLTIDAKLNGVEDGAAFFFVENGTVNGEYSGELADPLMFEPSSAP